MEIFKNLEVSATGIRANRQWMTVIANNIANANTTRTANGRPYRRQVVQFAPLLAEAEAKPGDPSVGRGVQVDQIQRDRSPFVRLYDPSHPDADRQGYILMSNVDPIREMMDMTLASRSYEANVAAFNSARSMYLKALEIGR